VAEGEEDRQVLQEDQSVIVGIPARRARPYLEDGLYILKKFFNSL